MRIRTKDGGLQALTLNRAQLYIHERLEEQKRETGKVRALILKGRQQGCSTYVEARYYHLVTHNKGKQAFILTHEKEATNNLFQMAKRYHNNCPKLVRPEVDTSNSKELMFGGLDSGYKVGTAGNKEVGRSQTVQYFHGSEVAFWANAANHTKGIMQTIVDGPGTEVLLESTANGIGNYFHQQWQIAERGESDFIPVFVPWFWQEEYTSEDSGIAPTNDESELVELYELTEGQLAWRRKKIVELSVNGSDGAESFKQEYPCTAAEAFRVSGENGLIKPNIVAVARICELEEQYAPLVIGVDPARFGDDRSSIIRRRGRKAYNLEHHMKIDTMQLVGIVAMIIRAEMPAKVFIDVGGLGAGVVDRLNELGFRDIVVAVNAGSSPIERMKFSNKRAEMWGLLNNWLKDQPAQIPDDDSLQADLIGVTYWFDSNSRLVLETKADMKKRGIRSPDGGDALAQTFAFPVYDDIDHYWEDSFENKEGRNPHGGY